ncbi:MAG: OmpA family protein [Marinomonas sp.]
MKITSKTSKALLIVALIGTAAPGAVMAQSQDELPAREVLTTVYGSPPADLSGLEEGPVIKGFISSRSDDKLQVTNADGQGTIVRLSDGTEIRASKGLFGINRKALAQNALLNGLPVEVKTVEWAGNLVATRIKLRNSDLKTASMIRNGTAQGFAQQTAATEALRGRLGDIDKYNLKNTTNVFFDTGRHNLSAQDRDALCATAAQAEAMDNALLLVVGYTDSTGSYDFNQTLSEKRAARVVNYLQQACGWKPYRMLTPTGMAEADPLADNSTAQGKAQNRRVAVNVLVSKSVDGI